MSGRPTTITQARINGITALMIDPGLPMGGAAERLGIARQTAAEWLRKGHLENPPRPIYRAFADAVTRAIAQREEKALRDIEAAVSPQLVVERRTKQVLDRKTGEVITLEETVSRQVPGDWRAQAWRLEHMPDHKRDYGGKIELSGPDGAPLAAVVPVVIDETAAEKMAEVFGRIRGLRTEEQP